MTQDRLTTAARAAGWALAGEPQDAEREPDIQQPLLLARPAHTPVKPVEAGWWRDWFVARVQRVTA